MIRRLLLLGFAHLAACATAGAEPGAPSGPNGPQVPAPPPEGDGESIEGVVARGSGDDYTITDAQGTVRAVKDDVRSTRLADNVGRRARVAIWWPGKKERRARVGTVTTLQVTDGPEVDAARAAIERFGCPEAALRASDPIWLEDRHDRRERHFKVLAERADKNLLLIWVDRDPHDPSRLKVDTAFESQGKMLAPLCAPPR